MSPALLPSHFFLCVLGLCGQPPCEMAVQGSSFSANPLQYFPVFTTANPTLAAAAAGSRIPAISDAIRLLSVCFPPHMIATTAAFPGLPAMRYSAIRQQTRIQASIVMD